MSTIRPSTNLKSKPFINSDSNSFIGDVLDIPPLLDKLRAMHGKISEEQVIAVALNLYESYNRIFLHDKEKWHEIKSDKIKWSDGTYRTINGCKNALKRLLKNYENDKYNSKFALRPFIISNDKEFIKNVLKIPILCAELNSYGPNVTEIDIITSAEKMLDEYNNANLEYNKEYIDGEELWFDISNDDFWEDCESNWEKNMENEAEVLKNLARGVTALKKLIDGYKSRFETDVKNNFIKVRWNDLNGNYDITSDEDFESFLGLVRVEIKHDKTTTKQAAKNISKRLNNVISNIKLLLTKNMVDFVIKVKDFDLSAKKLAIEVEAESFCATRDNHRVFKEIIYSVSGFDFKWLYNGNIRYSFSLDNIFLGNKSIDNSEDALLK